MATMLQSGFRRALAAATVALCAALGIGAASAETAVLKIVHFNDLDRMGADEGRGGVAKLASVVNQVRAEAADMGAAVLVTNGGDSISPSLLSGFDQGAHMIALFNQIGLSAMALGNHEFDFGPEVLVERIAEAEFAMLSNNARMPSGDLIEGVDESLMIDVGPYKVGVFGLTTPATVERSSPGPIVFADPVETSNSMSAELRDAGADLVIALGHTNLREDQALLTSGSADLVLSGDDHALQLIGWRNTVLLEAGGQAEYVGVVTVQFETVEGRRGPEVAINYDFEMINTLGVAEDPDLAAAVQVYEDQLSEELDIEIGTTETELDTRRGSVRTGETAFGNLLADAMRDATSADVALTNGGGIRADRIYDAGTTLTRRDILSELPFGNKTVLLQLGGADLLAALEHGVGQVEQRAGRFPQISGMSFSYDGSKPEGERVVEVLIGGEPIILGATYRLATNDFLGAGGDGYWMLALAETVIDANAGGLMAGQMIEFIEEAGAIAPVVEGRIRRIDG